MTRRLSGLSQSAVPTETIVDGVYLVRIERARCSWDKQKPYYVVRFTVTDPKHLAGTIVSARLYATAKALWKLSWFLRDFGYDTELLDRDEVDEKRLVGLVGVIKISHRVLSGRTYLNLDAFAKSGEWDELSLRAPIAEIGTGSEVA